MPHHNKSYTLYFINTIPRVNSSHPGMEQILERTGDKATVASVLLLTDGQANQSRDSIIAKMKGLTVSIYNEPWAYHWSVSGTMHVWLQLIINQL